MNEIRIEAVLMLKQYLLMIYHVLESACKGRLGFDPGSKIPWEKEMVT